MIIINSLTWLESSASQNERAFEIVGSLLFAGLYALMVKYQRIKGRIETKGQTIVVVRKDDPGLFRRWIIAEVIQILALVGFACVRAIQMVLDHFKLEIILR
jgi:hypothetical protein